MRSTTLRVIRYRQPTDSTLKFELVLILLYIIVRQHFPSITVINYEFTFNVLKIFKQVETLSNIINLKLYESQSPQFKYKHYN